MKILISIISFTFITSFNLFKLKVQAEDNNIRAILIYVDINKDEQNLDYDIFDPNNKSYIGTNDYIITSNAGISTARGVFDLGFTSNDYLIRDNEYLVNSSTVDKKNDAFQIIKEKRVQDYLKYPKDDWFRDDKLESEIKSSYGLMESSKNNSHMYAQYSHGIDDRVQWLEEQSEVKKKREILLNPPIKTYRLSELENNYINIANKIVEKNKDARIWFSLPRYDYFLLYSKGLTEKYTSFLSSIIDEFSIVKNLSNFKGFCFDTEQLIDYEYREFDTNKLLNGQSIISHKYNIRKNTKDELDYGNEVLNSIVYLSDYIHRNNKTFIWISSFNYQSDLSDYALEVVANQTDIFDYVLIQQDYNKENAIKSVYKKSINSDDKTNYKKISNTKIGFEYNINTDDIDKYRLLINSKNYSFVVYFGSAKNLYNDKILSKIQNVFNLKHDNKKPFYNKDFLEKLGFVSSFKPNFKPVKNNNSFISYKYTHSNMVLDYDDTRIVKRYIGSNQKYYDDKQYIQTYFVKDNQSIKIADFELKHDTLNKKHQLDNSLLLYLEKSDFAREYYDFDLINYELTPHIFIDGSNYRIADFK